MQVWSWRSEGLSGGQGILCGDSDCGWTELGRSVVQRWSGFVGSAAKNRCLWRASECLLHNWTERIKTRCSCCCCGYSCPRVLWFASAVPLLHTWISATLHIRVAREAAAVDVDEDGGSLEWSGAVKLFSSATGTGVTPIVFCVSLTMIILSSYLEFDFRSAEPSSVHSRRHLANDCSGEGGE